MKDLESFYHYFCIHAPDCTAKRILKFSLGRLAKVAPEANFHKVLEYLADVYGEYNVKKAAYRRGYVSETNEAMLESLKAEFSGGHDIANSMDDLVQYLERRNKRLGSYDGQEKSYKIKGSKLSNDAFLSALNESDLDI